MMVVKKEKCLVILIYIWKGNLDKSVLFFSKDFKEVRLKFLVLRFYLFLWSYFFNL